MTSFSTMVTELHTAFKICRETTKAVLIQFVYDSTGKLSLDICHTDKSTVASELHLKTKAVVVTTLHVMTALAN